LELLHCVILLDEIEKAHEEIYNILLQVFEDGRLTDGRGRVVDFKNTIIVMTSNLGSQKIYSEGKIGFSKDASKNNMDHKAFEERVLKEVEDPLNGFRPEFLNRLDDKIVFHPLDREHIYQIVDLLLKEVGSRLIEHGLTLNWTDSCKKYLATEGFDPKMGARPLRRIIQEKVEDQLSDDLLNGKFSAGDSIEIDGTSDGKSLVISRIKPNIKKTSIKKSN
jgi:ATP-dependent Clp protease ATP-binding subunit ClpC